jgi:hypothetical protein
MPNGRHRVLEGQEHVVPPEVLVPVLADCASIPPTSSKTDGTNAAATHVQEAELFRRYQLGDTAIELSIAKVG